MAADPCKTLLGMQRLRSGRKILQRAQSPTFALHPVEGLPRESSGQPVIRMQHRVPSIRVLLYMGTSDRLRHGYNMYIPHTLGYLPFIGHSCAYVCSNLAWIQKVHAAHVADARLVGIGSYWDRECIQALTATV